ncbi:MAG: hypothetical protein DDT19_02295 [Syntrophomonadaceae bacterium]|nr:hypothetical protein [Bacillota bacterium]
MRQIKLYYLTEELYERLRKVAFELRISHSELLRRALEEYLKKLGEEK